MALIDFIPFECISIHLDNKELIPVDPEVTFIVFFVNVNTEVIKFFCRKNPKDDPVHLQEITISWRMIKNIIISEGNVENRILIDFLRKCEFRVCELIVNNDVIDKLEATMSLMMVRLQSICLGRSEKEARESIRVLSTVEDSDFGLEEDMMKSASSSSSGIIPSSNQSAVSSSEIFAAASEGTQKTLDRTQYEVDETPLGSPEVPEPDVIPCSPDVQEMHPSTLNPIEEPPLQGNVETESDGVISPLSEGDFGGIVVPETDYEDNQSNSSDNCGEITPSNQEDVIVDSQKRDKTVGTSGKIEVLSVNEIKRATVQIVQDKRNKYVYYDDFSECPPDLTESEASGEAIEKTPNTDVILPNEETTRDPNQNVDASEEIQETPKKSPNRSRRYSIIELNDFIESSESETRVTDESQALQKMLQEDQQSKDRNDRMTNLLQCIDDLSGVISSSNENLQNVGIEDQQQSDDESLHAENISKKFKETGKKAVQDEEMPNKKKLEAIYYDVAVENDIPKTSEEPKKTEEMPKKKKVKTAQNNMKNVDDFPRNVVNEISKVSEEPKKTEGTPKKKKVKTVQNNLKNIDDLPRNVVNEISKVSEEPKKNEDTPIKKKAKTIENNSKNIDDLPQNVILNEISKTLEGPKINEGTPKKRKAKTVQNILENEIEARAGENRILKEIPVQLQKTEDNIPEAKKQKRRGRKPKNKENHQNENNKQMLEDDVNNNEIEEPPKRVLRKLKPPTTTTKRNGRRTPQTPRESKKRYLDSDSDEWTPHGIIKSKKRRRSVPILDEATQEESFFSSYSRATTLTKTRTRVVTRSARFCDEMNYYSEAEVRRRKTSSSRDNDESSDEDDFMTPRSSSPDYQETENTNQPRESVIVRDRSQSTPSTSTPSAPRTPRRRLSHTPKFALNEEPDARKCSLPFAFVPNENEFVNSFRENLSQASLGAQAEQQAEVENVQTDPKTNDEPIPPDSSIITNGGETQSSDLQSSAEQIPATDPARRLYKPFPIFTSESSTYNNSSPETPKQSKFTLKNIPTKRETKKAKFKQTKVALRQKMSPKRSVLKIINLPPVILSGITPPDLQTSQINELNSQPYLFQDVPGSQENAVIIARREVKLKQLVDKVNKAFGKKMSEKQFYLLAIEVFTMCLKCLHNLKHLKYQLLIYFNKIYCDILKLASTLD